MSNRFYIIISIQLG